MTKNGVSFGMKEPQQKGETFDDTFALYAVK